MATLEDAKDRLDLIIGKSRDDWYKPIQIAETLHRSRMEGGVNASNLTTYRTQSKHWRNLVTDRLVGKVSTSSAKFQDNVWDQNAMPADLFHILNEENISSNGSIERYIYLRFKAHKETIVSILRMLDEANPRTFRVLTLLETVRDSSSTRRSIDKVYEIIVYCLFETVVTNLQAEITVAIPAESEEMLSEFDDLLSRVLGISSMNPVLTLPAHLYRVGVTNAADRGLDMWANFGPVVQVKHVSLNAKVAERIVDQVESDRIIIVCREAEQDLIQRVLAQTSWWQRVQGIVTEAELVSWYEKCLRGRFSMELADRLLERLREQFTVEFPYATNLLEFLKERGYTETDTSPLWEV